jgi:hypothetical protein
MMDAFAAILLADQAERRVSDRDTGAFLFS